MPAAISIFELGNPEKIIASKSCFRARQVEIHWCFDGSAVVAHTYDSGEHNLYVVNRGLQAKLILDSGAINLVKWSPTVRQFAVVYSGTRKMAIFNIECTIVANFEEGFYRKELVQYSPSNHPFLAFCLSLHPQLHSNPPPIHHPFTLITTHLHRWQVYFHVQAGE